MSFYLDCCCVSETGSVRTHNEDNFCFFEENMPIEHQSSPLLSHCIPSSESLCVAVFDGMGGEAAGEVASFTAAQELVARANYTDTWTPRLISDAYQGISAAVLNARKAVKAQISETARCLSIKAGPSVRSAKRTLIGSCCRCSDSRARVPG